MSLKSRNIFVDLVKAYAIILVVLGHSIQCGSGENYLQTQLFFDNIIFKYIYSFHMPLFMLISGYLFAYGIKNSFVDIVTNKLRSLIAPICFWAIIPLVIYITTQCLNDSFSIMLSFKYYLNYSLFSLWFLWAVFLCSLLVVIVNKLFKYAICIYVLLFVVSFVVPDGYNLYLYKFMYPFFVIGYMFNKYSLQEKLQYIYRSKYFEIGVGALFFLMLLFYKHDMYIYISRYAIVGKDIIEQLYIDIYRLIIGLVGSIFTLIVLHKIYKSLQNKKFFDRESLILTIGKNTMGIYIISSIIDHCILSEITKSLTGPNYFVVIETIVIIILSIIMVKLIKRNNILNKLLLGAKV